MLAALALLAAACAWASPVRVLWIPAGAPDVDALERLLIRRPEVKLAVGVVPESLPASSTAALSRLWQDGLVEPALRLPGDPILPLLPWERSDLTPRLAAGRQLFQRALGRAPEGFVPGAGALDPATARALASLGFKWAAAASTEAALAGVPESLLALPSCALFDPEAGADADALLVFDEASGLAPPGYGLAAIERLAERVGAARLWQLPSTPSTTVAATVPLPASLWGDLSAWSGRPAQARTLARLAEAAAALERYQNSGTAALETLDRASAILRDAQASRRLAQAEAEEPALAQSLTRFYALLGQRPPEELLASTAAAHAAGVVSIEAAPGAIVFRGPDPADRAGDEDGQGAAACELESLKVSFDAKRLSFEAALGPGSSSESPPAVDLYIDINHRPGAGSQQLLPGRPAFARAADAWEFALTLSSSGAQLYRFGPQGAVATGRFSASFDAEARSWRVSMPAARLPGKPGSWGYLALCVRPGKPGEVLGALASRREQGQLDGRPRRSPPRFSAQRLSPAQAAVTRQQEPR